MDIFAEALAHGGDNEQAEFLNRFAEELFRGCKGDRGLETQCCYIFHHLKPDFLKFCKTICEFADLSKDATAHYHERENSARRSLEAVELRLKEKQRELDALEEKDGEG